MLIIISFDTTLANAFKIPIFHEILQSNRFRFGDSVTQIIDENLITLTNWSNCHTTSVMIFEKEECIWRTTFKSKKEKKNNRNAFSVMLVYLNEDFN